MALNGFGEDNSNAFMLFLLPYHGKSLQETDKEVGPGRSKLVLLLIGLMKYEIVQFLLYEYSEKSSNCVYITNIHR